MTARYLAVSPMLAAACGVLVLLIAAAEAVNGDNFDCDKPCPLTNKPVCGVDDIEYQNLCIAYCQGVDVKILEPCPAVKNTAGEELRKPARTPETSGSASREVMMKFAAEGFKLVGRQKMSAAQGKPDLGNTKPIVLNVTEEDTKRAPPPHHLAVRATRVTPDGHVYEQFVSEADAAAMLANLAGDGVATTARAPVPTMPEDKNNTGGRKLKTIFYPDDRYYESGTSWPYGPRSQVYFWTGTGWAKCSGTIIGNRALLTAGHCVSSGSGTWYSGWQTYPALYCASWSGSTCVAAGIPYPVVGYRYASTFTAWHNSYNTNWDIAVITLDRNPGVGYYGIAYNCRQNQYLYTAGYPGDKPSYTRWATSCGMYHDPCSAPYDQSMYCDVYPGQSGSGMWDSGLGVRYVVNWQSSSANYAVSINNQNWNTILGWRNAI